jgi:hypothetical protein
MKNSKFKMKNEKWGQAGMADERVTALTGKGIGLKAKSP